MAAEIKEHGINVNCVLPGIINTPPNRQAMPDADHSRWVEPEALADVILFLASERGARHSRRGFAGLRKKLILVYVDRLLSGHLNWCST